jgi:2'-5' RNA ligase
LGEVDEKKTDEIKDRLGKVEFSKFSVKIGKIGFFPNENYVKVIWVGLEENERTIELQKKVDESLANIFDKEKKFHPHVTLARVKFVNDKVSFKKNINEIEVGSKKFKICCFKLIKSTLTREGAVYEEIAEFKA